MTDWLNKTHVGDCRALLKQMAADGVRVQTCVTSPPYFGLRDYGVAGQIGLEASPAEYVEQIVAVFRGVRDVLADDGTLWLNLGDSYANDGKWGGHTGGKHARALHASPIGRNKRYTGLKPKDLIGIPWRVAFALQQPYYTGRIRDERLRYWLAGLVDGEGCLTILETTSPHGSGNSFPPILQVRMCDLAPIQRCAEITGLGNASPRQDPPSHGGNRSSYQWRLIARNAANIARELYPYLLVKKRQAVVLWNHQKVRESYETKRGVPIPLEVLEKQQALRALIRKLNRAEPVDMPSWLEEPQPMDEPGWYLRSDCIWHKPNPMPESISDRPTKAHEYLFLLAKSERYYYDAASIAEPAVAREPGELDGGAQRNADGSSANAGRNFRKQDGHGRRHEGFNERYFAEPAPFTRNRRTVWSVTTTPFRGAHFATFPRALIEPCIVAGSRPGDAVIDPFMGSGTTGQVATDLGRDFIGCELNPDYVELHGLRRTTIGMPL